MLAALAATQTSRHEVLALEGAGHDGPAGKRIPFGWTGFSTGRELRGLAGEAPAGAARFRVTVAVDQREEAVVLVRARRSRTVLGRLDLRYFGALQLGEAQLSAADSRTAWQEGVSLDRVSGQAPLLFVAPGADVPLEMQPHLMWAGTREEEAEFRERMRSGCAVTQWSWKLGTVLDGLLALGERDAARRMIARYFPDGETLVYEGPSSEPLQDRVYGVEGGLCFGALARLEPKHAGLDLFVEFCRQRADAQGVLHEASGVVKTEECYTISYPLAVLAAQRKDAGLRRIAVQTLLARRDVLHAGDDAIYQRGKPGELRFRNWARGLAWHLLGCAHTLRWLERAPEVEAEFRRSAALALRLQSNNGLWFCFTEEPVTGVETSGSAGIAAALAMGARQGVLGAEALSAARLARAALRGYLTPDGLLGGASQENKGGDALQREGYRVMPQYGWGVYAQLMGALDGQGGGEKARGGTPPPRMG
jgi:hypothetical protein